MRKAAGIIHRGPRVYRTGRPLVARNPEVDRPSEGSTRVGKSDCGKLTARCRLPRPYPASVKNGDGTPGATLLQPFTGSLHLPRASSSIISVDIAYPNPVAVRRVLSVVLQAVSCFLDE